VAFRGVAAVVGGARQGGRPSILVQVEYSEHAWRRLLSSKFERIVGTFVRFVQTVQDDPIRDFAYQRTLTALSRVAAYAGIGGKHSQYDGEAEWRQAALVSRDEASPAQTRFVHERSVQYIELPARADNKSIILNEVMLGPTNDSGAEERARQLLTSLGYGSDEVPMPSIRRSVLQAK
jgi:hypothetical protein